MTEKFITPHKCEFEHRFYPHDKVYHITKGSPQGVVLDISFSKRNGVKNLVSFGYGDENWYFDDELSKEQRM